MTTRSATEIKPLFSKLAGDPDLHELIELFVRELPARVSAMQKAACAGDRTELRRLAHQLKGAGGSYGFPWLQRSASRIEQLACGVRAETILAAMVELAETCNQICAGVNVPARPRAARPDTARAQRPEH
jgi:HPt (histidine-containing phosphotransfer) domain-containing protein